MWRRYGDVAFAAIFATAVSLEAIPLAFLTWRIAARLVGDTGGPEIAALLLGAVGSAALGLLLLSCYVLAYQHVSARHERLVGERRRVWAARWLRVLDGDGTEPGGRLDRASIEALLALRETIRGDRSDRIAELLER